MKKIPYYVYLLLALVVIAGALLLYEGDLLWKIQNTTLFLTSSVFFNEQMLVPGGLLVWCSTFFTQFFYYPWLGVLLLCAWWWLLMWLTKRAFRIPDRWSGLLLIPVGLLLLTIVDMGYWIYVLKLQGHPFVATIGTTAVAALLWAYRCMPAKHYIRTVFVFLVCAIGFPLMGAYGLAASLLMAIWSWRLKEHALIDTIVAILSVAAVPLFFYRFVFYQTNLANIYYAALPLYYVTEKHLAYYIPYYLLAAFFAIMAVMKPMSSKEPISPISPAKPKSPKGQKNQKNQKNQKSKVRIPKSFLVQTVVMVLLVAGVARYWFKDENFHHELAMQHSIDQLDWEGVLHEASRQECEPTRAIVMMKNLALGRLGLQGNEMFKHKNGSAAYNEPFGMRLMLISGSLMYYQYGMINYCGRLSTEMCVEFGWRPEYLKLLAKCAILNGEQQHARKYLNVLKQTLFQDEWAEQKELLVGNADAISHDAELGVVARMMHYDNQLSSDQGNIERFLMTRLSNSKYTGDPLFQEQALLATLWTRDINKFWQRFYDYIRLHPNEPMPRYYQEAAWLYAQLQERKDLENMPFDAGIKDTYKRFMEEAVRFDNAEVDVARDGLYPFFGETYYFDYYIMSQLPEY